MKKNLMFSVILTMAMTFCAVQHSWSQNSSPYWSLAGNSNAGASSKLGTTNNSPLKFFTNNAQRMQISSAGRVAIGTSNAFTGQLTVMTNGSSNPSGLWNRPTPPVFMGYGESASGNADFLLGMASNNYFARPVFFGRRTRGSLASPAVVQTDDYLASFLCSGYDGGSFQNPASIDFYVDATPTSGHVPTRLSLVTGTNSGDRQERLKILYNGDFDFNDGQMFLDQSTSRVGIGTTSPSYKLSVVTTGTAIYGRSTSDQWGVYGSSTYGGICGYGGTGIYGVYGFSETYGIFGKGGATGVHGDGDTYGVRGKGGIYGVYGEGDSYGIYGKSLTAIRGQGTNYGLQATGKTAVQADGSSWGVYATVSGGNGTAVVGYATGATATGMNAYSANWFGLYASTNNPSSYAGYFAGKVYASAGYTSSDKKLKKNIRDFKNALDIINALKPKHYDFRDDGDFAKMHLPQGHHYGLIAQDVEEVLPELISDTEFDVNAATPPAKEEGNEKAMPVASRKVINFKALNYTELIPILVKGMQEQDAKLTKLESENLSLQTQIDELKNAIAELKSSNGKLSYTKGFLGQNNPNPAEGNTTIAYSLPGNGTDGEIRLTDTQGRFIKSYKISGEGQLIISKSLLAAGVYNYSLYNKGRLVQTRQMVIAR